MMIIGVGTDILAFERIEASLNDRAFLHAVYTEKERAAAEKSGNEQRFLFTRFAGKEAVFKALGIVPDFVRLADIEILPEETGRPIVILHGAAQTSAKGKNICDILLSLSWENEYAVATAIAQG